MAVDLKQRYIPSEDEPYMSDRQIAYFTRKLLERKNELARKLQGSIAKIKSLETLHADLLDRSNTHIDLEFEIRSVERYRSNLEQIDRALERIDNGSFGYCALTGSEIGLLRLEAVPFAAMSVQALEMFEMERALSPGQFA